MKNLIQIQCHECLNRSTSSALLEHWGGKSELAKSFIKAFLFGLIDEEKCKTIKPDMEK